MKGARYAPLRSCGDELRIPRACIGQHQLLRARSAV
jgi:hypothetical protein